MWIFGGTLIWYHTHTHRHITHSGANSLTHPYKCIFTPPVTCLFMQTPPFLWENPLFLFFENSELTPQLGAGLKLWSFDILISFISQCCYIWCPTVTEYRYKKSAQFCTFTTEMKENGRTIILNVLKYK